MLAELHQIRLKGHIHCREFYDDTIRGLIENIHKNPIVEKDVLDIFKYNGRSINELLAEMNN